MNEQDNTQQRLEFAQQLKEVGVVIEEAKVKNNKDGFEKLALTPEQKIQISGLLQHMPALTTVGKMAGAYTVKFPKGLPHTLMALRQGGYGSPIINKEGIIGMASFTPMLGQAVVMGVFTVLSIATSQYFLARINKELGAINQKLDKILEFLYGDKKAELLAELSFIQYARDNYSSIMLCGDQKVAVLANIQGAKKVAMKDIEFYTKDLDQKTTPQKGENFQNYAFLSDKVNTEINQIVENLDISLQLYIISSLMEVYYAQNFSRDYIDYLIDNMNNYLEICVNKITKRYERLHTYFANCKVPAKNQDDYVNCKNNLENSQTLFEDKYVKLRKKLPGVLMEVTRDAEYYLEVDGTEWNMYYKKMPDKGYEG